MDLAFLGGVEEIGRSAVLVNETILLDYGLRSSTPLGLPVGDIDPAAVVCSHGHLDHVGAVPTLFAGPDQLTLHATPPTIACFDLLARDTLSLHGGSLQCPFTEHEIQDARAGADTHAYGESFVTAGHEITFFEAGHIPGSAHILVDDGETRLLYTGDFHTGTQRLVSPSTARPDADVVICESTYADTDHPPRDEVEAAFADFVRRTRWRGGTVVVPAFAIGRTQELLLVCAEEEIDCFVDGMGTEVLDILRRHPGYISDQEALQRAISRTRVVTGGDEQRRRIAEDGAVIVTTSGMLHGGPAMTYLEAIRTDPTNAIALTGFQVPGSPGAELLATGRCPIDGRVRPVSARVNHFSFSAHADREGLRGFLEAYADRPILLMHGDDTEGVALRWREDGLETRAPTLGERVQV